MFSFRNDGRGGRGTPMFLAICCFWIPLLLSSSCLMSGQTGNPDLGTSGQYESLVIWRAIKRELTGRTGADYWRENIKGYLIPGGAEGLRRLTGFIISSTPAEHPNAIVLGILDRHTPEVRLRFVDRRRNRVYASRPFPVGREVQFQGVGIEFVAVPFLVTFEADLNWVTVSEPRSRASEPASKTPTK